VKIRPVAFQVPAILLSNSTETALVIKAQGETTPKFNHFYTAPQRIFPPSYNNLRFQFFLLFCRMHSSCVL